MEVEHIWIWFQEVFQPGGGVNGSIPPSYLEIEAYSRIVLGYRMTPMEIRGVRGLAEAYVRIERIASSRARQQARANPKQPTIRRTVSMQDTEGLKALFAGRGARPRPGARTPSPDPPAR